MSLQLTFESTSEYLLVTVEGNWTAQSAQDAIIKIADKAFLTKQSRTLIDIRQLSNPDDIDRFYTGNFIANHWTSPNCIKVAAVWDDQHIDKFVENIAVNRGAHFIVLGDYDKALNWLLSDQ
jgi:hypothetical protein